MSEFLTLNAQKRVQTGKGVSRRLRAAGIVPGIFYSPKGENTPVQIHEKDLQKIYGQVGRTTVFNLEIESDGAQTTYPALFWDVDFYPIKNRIQHIDIFGVDLDKEIKVRVPLEFLGVAKGTKVGGKLETFQEIIEVYSKPLSLPKKISVDISNLDMNECLRIADLSMPAGVRAHSETHYAVVGVVSPEKEEEGDGGENPKA